MPKQLLHVAQVGSPLQGVGRERVSQRVRRNVADLRLLRVRLQDQPETLPGQPVAAVIQEERRFVVDREAPAARSRR